MSRANPFNPPTINHGNEKQKREREQYISYMFERIEEYAIENLRFDDSFTIDLKEQYEAKGHLTDRQFSALENIYERWVNV